MTAFTDLELAALRAIFLETPELAQRLEQQLEASIVTERTNSGGGFFTKIAVDNDARIVNSPPVLGHSTYARVNGLQHGLGFVLFIRNSRLQMLEGFAYGENTHELDFASLQFEIYNQPTPLLG